MKLLILWRLQKREVFYSAASGGAAGPRGPCLLCRDDAARGMRRMTRVLLTMSAAARGWACRPLSVGGRSTAASCPRAGATVLLDSVTALVQNELLWANGSFPAGPTQVAQQLLAFSRQAAHVIFVTDYIFSDAGRYNAMTQHYCKCLAQTDRALAAACDTVAEICGTTVTLHKGTLPLLLEQPAGAAVRELVIAGAGQGALDYVQRTYGGGPEALHHCRDDAPPDFSARYICGLEHYVRYCLETGRRPGWALTRRRCWCAAICFAALCRWIRRCGPGARRRGTTWRGYPARRRV